MKEYFDDFRLYINKLFKLIKDTFIKLFIMFKMRLKKIYLRFKSLSLRNKLLIILGILIIILLIILGLFVSRSFYSNINNSSILNNRVGDFDYDKDNLSVMMYVEYGKDNYKKINYFPDTTLYEIDITATKCTKSCNLENDNNSNCYYNYDNNLRKISITSNSDVSCKFYFKEISDTDININVYINDINGELEYLGNLYKKVNNIPDNSNLIGYQCINNSNISFNSNILNVDSIGKDTCDVYFTTNE